MTDSKKDEGVITSFLYKGKVEVKFLGPTPEKPSRHVYMVDGERKTGVTTFLGIVDKSRALVGWAVDLFRDFLLDAPGEITENMIFTGSMLHEVRKQEAADIGTVIHGWCEQYIKHKLGKKGIEMPEMPEDKAVQVGVMSFLDWEKQHKVKFISSERTVYSRKHDFIGTMDIEAKIDGRLCLVDLKSSNGLYNTVRLQTAAYVMADQEESGRKYDGRWAIRLAKETEKEYDARMEKKNSNRVRAGKKPIDYPAYQVFEAKDLDEGYKFMKRDKEAFIACQALFKWNEETDFYKEKKV